MCPPLRANQNISRRAGEDTRPYGGNRPRDVGLDHPGAGMEPQQRQFLQTQGPVARREFRHPLRFCAPEGFCLLQGVTPVNGGPGKGDYEHEVLIWSRPRRRFAQSLVAPGEAQRSGFAGKRRSKGTNAVFAARRKRRQADFATTSRHGQSHSPPAGGETPLRKEPSSGPMRASGPTKSVLSSLPHPAPSGPPSLSPLAFGHLPLTRGVGPRGEGLKG